MCRRARNSPGDRPKDLRGPLCVPPRSAADSWTSSPPGTTPSSPARPCPLPDPTLLFVNAGMVPFKPYFTGEAAPLWERATSVQKCVRTLDIEEVGRTTRHGSFFQMNGNFSFGDYFKDEAIAYAWELSTRPRAEGGYGLDPDRIWVTVHHSDTESRSIWRRVAGLPDERIVDRGTRTTSGPWASRTVRALLRAVLRPRPGPRPGRRSGGRRGPVHGVLEPRLHAVRARPGPRQVRLPLSSGSCPAATSTPAWAWNGWRPSSRAWTTSTRSTRIAPSSSAPPTWPASATELIRRPTYGCGSSPTTSVRP